MSRASPCQVGAAPKAIDGKDAIDAAGAEAESFASTFFAQADANADGKVI